MYHSFRYQMCRIDYREMKMMSPKVLHLRPGGRNVLITVVVWEEAVYPDLLISILMANSFYLVWVPQAAHRWLYHVNTTTAPTPGGADDIKRDLNLMKWLPVYLMVKFTRLIEYWKTICFMGTCRVDQREKLLVISMTSRIGWAIALFSSSRGSRSHLQTVLETQ